MMAKTERLRRSFFPPKLKLGLITFTRLNLINCKTFTILHNLYCCYVYTRCNLFAHSSCTSLLILIHSILYCTFDFIAHFTLYFFLLLFYLYWYILSCVVLHILHCPLSGPDLIYISLLIIFCIIEYVTNKKPWNLNQPKKNVWVILK